MKKPEPLQSFVRKLRVTGIQKIGHESYLLTYTELDNSDEVIVRVQIGSQNPLDHITKSLALETVLVIKYWRQYEDIHEIWYISNTWQGPK